MKLRKILAVTAVAATMTAAFAVNAMADTTNEFFDFEYKDGVITLSTEEGSDVGQPSKAPYTMLVVKVDSTGFTDKEIADGDIKQIDQADAPFTTIKVGDLTAVSNCAECTANKAEKCSHTRTYEIRLGGDGNVRWGTLEVKAPSTDPENPYANSTRLIGDVNDTVGVDTSDAVVVLNHAAYVSRLTGEKLQAANVNGDTNVDTADAVVLLNHSAYIDTTSIDCKTTVGDIDPSKHVAEDSAE